MEKTIAGSALYYPNIDVRDPAWLRSALLYWDNIYTIVPRAVETPYQTEDTQICAKEGCLRPLYCDDYPNVIKALAERTVELVRPQAPPFPFNMATAKAEPNLAELCAAYTSGTRVKMHPDKVGFRLLHPDKVSAELRDIFGHVERSGSSEWLLVNPVFSDLYMAALALLLAEEKDGLVPVTNSSIDHGAALLSLLTVSPFLVKPERGMLVSLTMKSLRIDPSAKVQQLIQFKQKRHHQLADLSSKLEELNTKIKEAKDLKGLEQQARKIYETDIERELDRLASELRAASIQSAWEGVYRGVFITVPAQSLLSVADHAMHPGQGAVTSGMMIGTGALLTLTDVAVKTYFARKKARDASKFTYLLDAQRKFGLPSESSALPILQQYEQLFDH